MIVCYAFVVAQRLREILKITLLLALTLGCAARGEPATSKSSARPIVILIAVDGWRWDYLDRFNPPTLARMARTGVQADGLIPVFPSKTFPNHYSIVTGLYPARHGITSNSMVDPNLPGRFTLSNRDVQQDTRWWGGEPLWVTAERQGQIAATMFWPGSDVMIAGDRPTFWKAYDHDFPNEARVDLVLEWLDQDEAKRPTFLTLYFSDVDSAGHDFGPDGEETREAALGIDRMLDRLERGVRKLDLEDRVNYIVVSDHGMAQLSPDRVIVLDDYIDVSKVDIVDSTPIVGLNAKPGVPTTAIYNALKNKHPALAVYLRSNLPEPYRLRDHPRMPEVIGVADDGWHVTTREEAGSEERFPLGNHGYDPAHRSMHGVFVAVGPRFKANLTVPAFSNLHIYELICRLLGIAPSPNDGTRQVTASFLR
jgi:predicted AlkP superfamily pyrophosphatase or phosphodiesterase